MATRSYARTRKQWNCSSGDEASRRAAAELVEKGHRIVRGEFSTTRRSGWTCGTQADVRVSVGRVEAVYSWSVVQHGEQQGADNAKEGGERDRGRGLPRAGLGVSLIGESL